MFRQKQSFPKPTLNLTTTKRKILPNQPCHFASKIPTVGLGAKLVKETLPLVGTPCVEAVAVMAKYNPFFEKAGMKKIAAQQPDLSCQKAVQKLQQLGVNPVLMVSEKHSLTQLRKMSLNQIKECKNILAFIGSPRFRRSLFPKKPYMNNQTYRQALETASIQKIAKALHVLSILLQVKVYLLFNPFQSEFGKNTMSSNPIKPRLTK
jgi:hypothetical protein